MLLRCYNRIICSNIPKVTRRLAKVIIKSVFQGNLGEQSYIEISITPLTNAKIKISTSKLDIAASVLLAV